MKHRGILLTTLLIVLILNCSTVARAEEEKLSREVIDNANSHGTVSVIVGLKVPWQREDTLHNADVIAQRQAIQTAQQQLLTELTGTRHEVVRRFQEIPGIALDVGPDAVAVLEKSPTVINVLADRSIIKSRIDGPSSDSPSSGGETINVSGNVPLDMFERAAFGDTVLVLVGLKAPWRPEGVLSESLVSAQRNVIAASQDYLLAELSNTNYRITRRFQKIPGIALEVGLDALKILDRSAAVTNILNDRPAKPQN